MQTIKAQQGQTLLDIALAGTGSVEAVWEMAVRNDMQVDGDVLAGSDYLVPAVLEKTVTEYYHAQGITPATNPEIEG